MDWGDIANSAIAALIGGGVGAWVTLNFERIRGKAEATVSVVRWTDTLVDRLQHLIEVKRNYFLRIIPYKESLARAQQLYFELTIRAYAREELVRVGIAFGEGSELKAAEAIRETALGIASAINEVSEEQPNPLPRLATIERQVEELRTQAKHVTGDLMRKASIPHQLARIAGTVDG